MILEHTIEFKSTLAPYKDDEYEQMIFHQRAVYIARNLPDLIFIRSSGTLKEKDCTTFFFYVRYKSVTSSKSVYFFLR